jgi:transcriptional regulator with XRE-family HTH domain
MGTLRGTARDAEGLGLPLQQGHLAAGLTQRQLADQMNVSQSYIWALESGKDVKVLERIFAVMKATGVTMSLEVPDGQPQR